MAKLLKSGKRNIFSKLMTKLSAKNRDAELSVSDEPYPLLTEEMILPPEQEIRLKEAIKIYKQHMLDIGFLEKSELGDFVASFKEECKEYEQQLKDEANWAKDTLTEARTDAKMESKKIKKQIAKSKDEDEKNDLAKELVSIEGDVLTANKEADRLVAEHVLFKKDKRAYLVNYINTEVHGQNWQEK